MFIKVAGVTFEGRQETIAKLRGNEPVTLVREPHNTYDKNAIAVWVTAHDGTKYHVGYLPREWARDFAELMSGPPIKAKIAEITGGFETESGDIASRGIVLDVTADGDED